MAQVKQLARIVLMLGLAAGTQIDAWAQGIGAGGARGQTGSSRSMEARQYRSNTMLGDAIIQTDPETRSLIIITDANTQEQITKVIENLDRPKPQVLIKVLFLEVTHRDALDIGVEGSYTYTHDGLNSGTVGTAWGLAELTSGGFWTLAADDWTATLRALSVRGKTEVLSRPSILARNNQEAVIIVGQEIPLITNTRITDQGNAVNTVSYTEIGIILRVTPFITSEGTVEMIINPEISSLTDEEIPIAVTDAGVIGSPVIAKRSAETVVVTADGQTVIIGGLVDTEKTEVKTKVPILGDIPLLGLAFRRTQKEVSKKELLIFLTPYIVENTDELGVLSRRETTDLEMIPENFPPERVERFLDGMGIGPATDQMGME